MADESEIVPTEEILPADEPRDEEAVARIQLHITRKRLTIKDLLAIEEAQEGRRPNHTVFGIMAKCMHDGQGHWLKRDEAIALLEGLDLEQSEQITAQFNLKLKAMQGAAVPPGNGSK